MYTQKSPFISLIALQNSVQSFLSAEKFHSVFYCVRNLLLLKRKHSHDFFLYTQYILHRFMEIKHTQGYPARLYMGPLPAVPPHDLGLNLV
jgi:hypothetical protein